VLSIGEDAFKYCENVTILCTPGSFAENYAVENEIPYEHII
jgi:hypothetical protein